MEATSMSDVRVDDLHKQMDHFFEIAESLDMHRLEVLRSKSVVMDEIFFIEKLLIKAQTVSRGAKRQRVFLFSTPSQFYEEKTVSLSAKREREFVSKDAIQSFEKRWDLPSIDCMTKDLTDTLKAMKFSSSMNEGVRRESVARYLFVSNGCAIWLLDLKQSKDSKPIKKDDDVQLLPKIASLNLIDEQLPVSVGLFRSGSDVYMIGGHRLPTNFESPRWWLGRKNPSNWDVYKSFCQNCKLKGTSNSTYRLSTAYDGTLSGSECDNVLRLKSPKFWPVVEEIDGRLHVFDSAPSVCAKADIDWMFSHEIFEYDKMSFNWRFSKSVEIQPQLKEFITNHVVVGSLIFAVTSTKGPRMVFDSIKNKWDKWEAHDQVQYRMLSRCFAETVWDILLFGCAKCVEEIKLGEDSYYVLFALLQPEGDCRTNNVDAAAYLVTSTGKIICMQELWDFFQGPVKPNTMCPGMVTKVDKEGKAMCAIVFGVGMWAETGICKGGYLFCNTFNVELVTGAASKFRGILETYLLLGAVVQEELVCVDTVIECIYKIDRKERHLADFVGVQACFF